jgi:BASS family bile acid:Na+ symporter
MDINEIVTVLLKISLVIFMAGNLLDMGLRLNPQNALRGLRDVRFVAITLLWGFVLGPALAYLITLVLPLEYPYATGLILIGMTPCAPFLPMIVSKAKGDLGYTAAFMLLASAGTVLFMPFALPLMVKGLTVSPWAIARPLLIIIFLPLAVGMAILRVKASHASRIQPFVKKATGIFTVATGVLCIIVYGEGILGVAGSLAVASQMIFFLIMTTCTYWFGFGLQHEQKIVLSAGMATRNLGAALAPLFAIAEIDQRAIVMVVLGLPLMVLFALLSAKWFGRRASSHDPGEAPSAPASGGAA